MEKQRNRYGFELSSFGEYHTHRMFPMRLFYFFALTHGLSASLAPLFSLSLSISRSHLESALCANLPLI